MQKANEKQVGGTHYQAESTSQHWDVMADLYGPAWFVGNATKYILRFGRKERGVEGLEKAVHYLEKFLELEKAGGVMRRKFCELDQVQRLADAYAVTSPLLRRALHLLLSEDSVNAVEMARDFIHDVITEHTHTQGRVRADDMFAQPPIKGYRALRGDQVNLINDLHMLGGNIGAALEKVIDMYQAEDAQDHEAMAEIQREFSDAVQSRIASDVVPEGEAEDDTYARRTALIAPLEDAAKAELGKYDAPAEARLEGARWLSQAKLHIQQGLMFAVRAITRPEGF